MLDVKNPEVSKRGAVEKAGFKLKINKIKRT